MTVGGDRYKYFRVEAAEILEALGKGVLDLEKGAAPAELTSKLLRLAHTLKGAARIVKHTRLAELAHAIEDALVPLRDDSSRMDRAGIDAALALLDAMAVEVAGLSGPVVEGGALPATRAASDEALPTVRADVAEVEVIIDGLAEAELRLEGLRTALVAIARARHLAEKLAVEETAHLRAELVGCERTVEDVLDRVSREVRLARERVEQLRLLPASTVFATLERVARDAGHATGKRVTFTATGGEMRLDAHVLGVLQAALVQLVRNSVAHGIEGEEERVARGKPNSGAVALVVARSGRRALFTCTDDGRGVDLEGVRRSAGERGVASPDGRRPDRNELLHLLMKGGVTTSSEVTEVSGRGVGLDVVREAVARLGGEVRMETETGRGTSFEISVPVSVASLEALVVEAGGIRAAIPVDAVREAIRLERQQVAETASGDTIVHAGEAIPFVPLQNLLGRVATTSLRVSPEVSSRATLVIEAGGSSAAIAVDALLGIETLVLRALSPFAHVEPIVAAASLDASGDPRLVLDPEVIVSRARRTERTEVHAGGATVARDPLLVIDDSLTTRMLEQSILESAGYEVEVASSAIEGLEKAKARRHALFLVDVEMPGMDGFTFVEQTRGDPRLRETPAILVTSRASPEDRRRGAEAGASAYIIKGEFNQTELLRIIRGLLGEG